MLWSIGPSPSVEAQARQAVGGRVLDLWGKLCPRRPAQYHPLLHHLIDVAITVEALWTQVLPAATRDLYCSLIEAEPPAVCQWLAFLAGLHDLGKATPGFQGQVPEQRRRLCHAGWVLPYGASRAHDVLGLMILHGLIASRLTAEQRADIASLDLATVVAAHHGSPVSPQPSAQGERHLGNQAWDAARTELFLALLQLAALQHHTMPPGLVRPPRRLLPILGGLVRVADWVASRNTPSGDEGAGEDYADRARARVEAHLDQADWGREAAPLMEFRDLFGFDPNDMQGRVARLAGPVPSAALVLVEAPTGSGKTEAALHLAHLWEGHGRQAGLYLALPTQATATAIQERMRGYPAFGKVRLVHDGAERHDDSDPPAIPSRAGRLLERLVVGTIDQGLLAVLSDRQAWVRLLGLANKTVILDEVHAYDTYTSNLLLRLVEWLAALNCSVVVLSATLAAGQRAELLQAYGAVQADAVEIPYPRVTLATSTVQHVAPLPAGAQREIALRHVAPRADLAAELAAALAGGGCAAVICNTVAAAQHTYLQLKQGLPPGDIEVELLHARFPLSAREQRERRAIARFGKHGERPARAVLVATQVVEQSLDVDFDLLVSEWAPMDTLIQRLGRLHRHRRARPPSLQTPHLWLLPPEVRDGVPDFGGTAAVYEEYILLRTWQQLRDRRALVLPAETEALIEACYGPADLSQVDEPLATRLHTAARRLASDREAQQYAALQQADASPGATDGPAVSARPAGPALARRHDLPTAEVVCLQPDERGWRLPLGPVVSLTDRPTPDMVSALLRGAVTLRGHETAHELWQQPQPESWRRHPVLGRLTPLILDEHMTAHLGRSRLRLDPDLGLVIE